jgi:hypothetical protein
MIALITTRAPLVLAVVAILVSAVAAQQGTGIESISVARSVRESRMPATEFCQQSRVGFANANIEDRYTFRSVSIRGSDGLVTDANGNPVATGHFCIGPTADRAVFNLYMEGVLGDKITFKGNGECHSLRADFPEAGITPAWCFFDLHDLPTGYVGGLLATNSVISRAIIGDKSDPPGYTQASIAVIRLWKRQ